MSPTHACHNRKQRKTLIQCEINLLLTEIKGRQTDRWKFFTAGQILQKKAKKCMHGVTTWPNHICHIFPYKDYSTVK